MKAIILITGFVLATTFSFAGHGETIVDRIMHRKISYPESLREKGIETTVRLRLRVVSEYEVEIVRISSDSEEMNAAVAEQVRHIRFRLPKGLVGSEFSYTYRFKVQD